MKEHRVFDSYFMEIARPILEHSVYQQMRGIRHHRGSVFDHCVDVAYGAYLVGKKLGLDCRSIIRGGLLHDFYLYKYRRREHHTAWAEGFRHSRLHPRVALRNAETFFELNGTERDIIIHHMFPVGLPRSREAWVVSVMDKISAAAEYGGRAGAFASVYYRRLLRAGNRVILRRSSGRPESLDFFKIY
ncbi:MAG: HD domain-containing protein [Gracilibacteraceae bacterium]|nr:HD domain-containing protein [Gracilibacteraceae bacterium]